MNRIKYFDDDLLEDYQLEMSKVNMNGHSGGSGGRRMPTPTVLRQSSTSDTGAATAVSPGQQHKNYFQQGLQLEEAIEEEDGEGIETETETNKTTGGSKARRLMSPLRQSVLPTSSDDMHTFDYSEIGHNSFRS